MQTLLNLDVVQILQAGVSGLCFLLAFFVYSLLRKAIEVDEISDNLIKLIRMFMGVTIVFVLLVFLTTVLNTFISKQKIERVTIEAQAFEKQVQIVMREAKRLRIKNVALHNKIKQLENRLTNAEPKLSINDAWVKLYEHDNFRGREIVVKYPDNIKNFGSFSFHDKTSSAKWKIPIGWRVYLFKDDSYSSEFVVLEGTDKLNTYTDLKRQIGRGDEASSLKWEKHK